MGSPFEIGSRTVEREGHASRYVLAIARQGLHRRARRNNVGDDEGFFLDTLFQIAGSGRTPAEELLLDYETKWHGSVDPVFTDYAY